MNQLHNTLAGVLSPLGLKPTAAADSTKRRPRGRRGQQSDADHKAALSRAYIYQQGRIRSPREAAALDAEFERRMREGPEFLRVRGRSEFREAPLHRLDREQRAKLHALFFGMANAEWKHRDAGRHRGTITRTCESVMGSLLFLAARYPRLFPSLECLARLARCCKQSVVSALATLERLGWITRHRRLQRRTGLLGPEAVQATNGYELHTPRKGWGLLGLLLFKQQPESNSWSANGSESLSYLRDHPETWGAPGIATCDAYGRPPSAVCF